MTFEVLAADQRGHENVQRWAAGGLPVPPSWRVDGDTVRALELEQLVARLRQLPAMFGDERYWVLHQGAMNAESQRESLLNLDSDRALAAALNTLFRRDNPPTEVVIQALPRQRAAGVLFTRHPLRQDLSHMVVEGVVGGGGARQRLIFDQDGSLVYRGEAAGEELDTVVRPEQLLALADQLRRGFERPQAGEWIHDGERLWLLQTLPVGSLPVPREAWTRRGATALFNQAVTPLWYTLAGRWFKTGFWWRLIDRRGWNDLARVEPYRRQQSHLYTNSDFFRRLLPDHPGALKKLPPAWRPLEEQGGDSGSSESDSGWQRRRGALTLAWLARAVNRWRYPPADRERAWRGLMALDRFGERLARREGQLVYLNLPDRTVARVEPLPLSLLLTGEEMAVLDAVLGGDRQRIEQSTLRPGADPVHAPLKDKPPQLASLNSPSRARALRDIGAAADGDLRVLLGNARQARAIRFALGERLRAVLFGMAAVLVDAGLLAHPDDIFFLYFDELWELWMQRTLPASAAGEVLGNRKVRYLEDAHAGAPDWKMDRIGFGFGGGDRFSPVLRGSALTPGRVSGPLRRLCSAWGLNRLQPGDIVVVDQVDPSWVPWLAQAGALVIAEKDPLNAAAALATAADIPAIWGVSDIMHSVVDGQNAQVDGEGGELKVES